MFPIKTGIPLPSTVGAGRPSVEFPFVDLMPSDSFFVPIGEGSSRLALNRVRAKAQRWKTATGLKAIKLRICLATNPDTHEPAVGVWRIS